MSEHPAPATVLSFGPFEADLTTQELRKHGVRLRLPGQSFQILAILLQHAGQMVSREELQSALWPADTFVDSEKGINAAINRLREALSDSADHPRYVETLPRRGYRLLVPVTHVVSGAPTLAPPASHARPHRVLHWAILGALVVALAAFPICNFAFRAPKAAAVLGFSQLTNDGVSKPGPMATDGSSIFVNEVLPGQQNVIVHVSIHGGEAIPVPVQLKQPTVLDISPDSTELLLQNDEGNGSTLWMQPVVGGSARRLGDVYAHDARFNPDGTSIILGQSHDIYSITTAGTSLRKLLTIPSGVAFAFQYSPDGVFFRFSTFDVQIDNMFISQADLDGSGNHQVLGGCCGRWTPDGRNFVFQNRLNGRLNLWTIPVPKRFSWSGRHPQPIQLTAGPLNFEYPLPSKDGKHVFAIGTSHRAELTRYDQTKRKYSKFLSGVSAEGLAFSRNGQWVAYSSFPDGTLWRSRLDGSERRQLTFPPLRVFLPRWSPDGTQIAFNADLPEIPRNIYLISSDGGTPQRVFPSEQSQTDVDWSLDGASLVFSSLFVSHAPIYTLELQSKRVSELQGSSGLFSPRLSPDGKFVAAISTDGPGNLMLFDVASQTWAEIVKQKVGNPVWSRDGRYIYFQNWDNQERGEGISRLRLSDRRVERVADVKDAGRLTTGTFVDWFGLAADDSLLFALDISTQEIYALDVQWP